MSDVYPIRQTFVGGEISPRLQARVESQLYQTGLAKCENWQIKPLGSVRRRSGFAFKQFAQSNVSRLVNFSRANDTDVMFELNDNEIRAYDRNGPVNQLPSNYILDPDFLEGNAIWQTDALVDNYLTARKPTVTPEVGITVDLAYSQNPPGKNGYHYINQKLPSLNPGDPHEISFDYINQTNGQETFGGLVLERGQIRVMIVDTFPSGTFDILYYDTIDTYTTVHPDDNDVVNNYTFQFTPTSSIRRYALIIEVGMTNFRDPEPEKGDFFTTSSSLKLLFRNFDAVNLNQPLDPLVFPSPWGADQIADVRYAQDTAEQQLVFVHPNVQPYVIEQDKNSGAFSFGPVVFDSKPVDWDIDNWPSVVEFFQGRLWFAASPANPSKIWGSKVGEFFEQKANASNNPDDPVEFTLITNGVIQWLVGNKVLLIGTDRSEWVGYGSKGIITADDFRFERQSGLGSVNISPVTVSDQVAYVGLNRKTVRTINFDGDQTQTWASQDISLQADHIFNSRILDMAYARDPDYQLAVVTGDGNINMCMHDRVFNVTAWYRYTINGGRVLSIEKSNDSVGSAFWVVIERDNAVTIELLDESQNQDYLLDSYVLRQSEVLTQESGAFDESFDSAFDGQGRLVAISGGMDHLDGLTVSILVYDPVTSDDNNNLPKVTWRVHPDRLVSNNLVKLEEWAANKICVVGLPYTASGKTLRQEGGNRMGTTQGSKRHHNRIFARMAFDSAAPLINGYRPKVDYPDSQNPLDTLVDYDLEVRSESKSKQGEITFEQDLPLRTEIAGLFGKLVTNNT